MDDHTFEVLQLEFESLREEFMEKMKASYQMGYYKVATIGAILGAVAFGTGGRTEPSPYLSSVFFVALLLPVAFDVAMYLNGWAMLKIGEYMRTEIEPALKRLAPSAPGLKLWEESIESRVAAESNAKRIGWTAFELVQPVLTLSLQFIIVFNLIGHNYWIVAAGGIAIVLEVGVAVMVFTRRTG